MHRLHAKVVTAFRGLEPSGMLATAILDQKAENFVTAALAAVLNSRQRIARTEYKRVDLVVAAKPWQGADDVPREHAEYQAKCTFLNDYRTHLRARKTLGSCRCGTPKDALWWCGECLKHDLECTTWAKKPTTERAPVRGGLFYLLDVFPVSAQAKYSEKKGKLMPLADAIELVEHLVGRKAEAWESSKSAKLHGADVKVHMGLFDLA